MSLENEKKKTQNEDIFVEIGNLFWEVAQNGQNRVNKSFLYFVGNKVCSTYI